MATVKPTTFSISLAPGPGGDNANFPGNGYQRKRPDMVDPQDTLYNSRYIKGEEPPDDATDTQ